jgi:hypothetical protein
MHKGPEMGKSLACRRIGTQPIRLASLTKPGIWASFKVTESNWDRLLFSLS